MIKRTIFKYILLLLSLAALCGAEFAGMRPCGAGFAAALLYYGLPAVIVLPCYILFSVAFDFSLAALSLAAAVSVAAFAAALFSLRWKNGKKFLFALFLAASQSALLLQYDLLGPLLSIVWGVLTLALFAASVCFLKPVLEQKLKYKLLETEIVSGGLLLVCISLGLGHMQVYRFDAAYLLAAFCIPFAASVASASGGVTVGMCFGAGLALRDMTAAPIAFMAFAALVTALFAAAPRPLSSLSVAVAYVLVSCLFGAPPYWQQTVCFFLGSVAFAFVPPRVLRGVRDRLFSPATVSAARGIVGRAALDMGNNLLGASRIFDDMRIAMVQVPESETTSVLERKVCSRCAHYAACAAREGFGEALAKMERNSAVKGRASVSELPSILSECVNLSALVSTATEAASARHEQALREEARKEGRKIVAQQLGLMSSVLRQMGERVKLPVHFDSEKEQRVAAELCYRGAVVPEVLVTDDTVSVVLQSETLTHDDVAHAVSKTLHAPYKFVRGGADVLPGYTLMLFARAPRYDVAFSVAASAKEERSGDNHSFIHLGGDRFMMALCDGMGSGDAAEKASETAIELVESFFKAGLDSMSAIECVNRFLALNECERFSTLDITVIDLNSGDAEIIKLSCPATVIKSSGGVRAVSGSSLPMGVFEEVQCGHAAVSLRAGDEIVMATDGVTDALGSPENFMAAVSAQSSADPQAEARNILECATAFSGGKLRDDGTVLCARIYEKGKR